LYKYQVILLPEVMTKMADGGFTPFTDPEIVAAYLQPVLERLGIVFSAACERTSLTFSKRNWSADAALAAYLIRKEVLEDLRVEGMQVEEEEVEIEHKALCGLLLRLPLVHLKIRKSKDGEIPAAGSRQSLSFYNWNLLVFPQAEDSEALPLHLLLLWNDSRKGQLETLLLVCVEGSEWRWRIPVFQRRARSNYEFNISSSETRTSETSSSKDFSSAFDSGNEDVPLKLSEKENIAQTTETEAKSDEVNEQADTKKKAQ
jgi:hypothetical protein